MEEKKNLLTYAGLKKLEDELHDLKVVKEKKWLRKSRKPESRGICPKTLSMMRPRTSSGISKPVSRKLKKSSKR